jgi:hypothetical protein
VHGICPFASHGEIYMFLASGLLLIVCGQWLTWKKNAALAWVR